MMMNNEWAYFDYAATTPVDPVVLENYYQSLQDDFANTGGGYQLSIDTRERFENAKQMFAKMIHADQREIIFTSGATESNNLALLGACEYHGAKNPRIITLQTEHKAILDPIASLAKSKVSTVVLPVSSDGLLDLDLLEETLKIPTTLVSVMLVNNETGIIQPIKKIAEIVHRAGAKLHVDAAQALGKVEINITDLDVDMMSFSGHKIYAPKGIGALYVRRLPKMRLQPQIIGGGQQNGLRSGTLPVALIKVFCLATEVAVQYKNQRNEMVQKMASKLLNGLPNEMQLNTIFDYQIPHILSIDVAQEAIQLIKKASEIKIALAAGSACQSASDEGSHVLKSMGLIREATQSIRVSISHLTKEVEIDRLLSFLKGEIR